MTAQTQVFYFNQRQWVVLFNPALPTLRYEKVYAKNLTISRGVDNILEFAFINQNQKPVDISGIDITARILNADGTQILVQKTCTPVFPVTGITTLRLSAEDIAGINQQYCYYSLEIPVGAFNYPVFVNSDGGARGQIFIVDSVLPSFVNSSNITIPSHQPPYGSSQPYNPQVQPPYQTSPITYYSSTYSTSDSPTISTQVYMSDFTGNTQWQGSVIGDFSFYYNIGSVNTYTAANTTVGFNITGYHPYLRLMITNVGTPPANTQTGILAGDITQILAR